MTSVIERPLQLSLLALLLLWTASGCAAGWGSAYPGAATRFRSYGIYERVDANHVRRVDTRTEESGGGSFGGLVAARAGVGTLTVGDESFSGTGTDLQAELHYSFNPILSVGVGIGYQQISGNLEQQEGAPVQASWSRTPLMVYGQLVPLKPFLLRAGAGGFIGGEVERDDAKITRSTSGTMLSAGAALITPLPGAHFLVGAEWQRADAGHVSTSEGEKKLEAEQVVLSITMLF